MNGFVKPSGYHVVDLYKNSKRQKHYIHRLVAEAFIPNPDNKTQVNHIDENKANNNVENLEWVTCRENILSGTCVQRANNTRYDKKVAWKPVAQYSLNGELIKIFDSIEIAVNETGINRKTIYNSCNNKVKPRTYIWKYF